MTTVGYGDISPYTGLERAFTLLVMIFGVWFYSYAISNLSSILNNFDARKHHLKTRLGALNKLAEYTGIPLLLQRKIQSHIETNHRENTLNWFNQEALLNELPTSLATIVSYHLHHRLVEKVYFLQDKSPEFIAYIAPKLRLVHFSPGEILYKELEHPEEVFFLTRGRVHLLANNWVVFKTFVQGSYLGEIEIIERRLREHSVATDKDGAEILVLSRSEFLKMLEDFPLIADEVYETASLRILQNAKGKQHALGLVSRK